jgi:hypothetical protein
MSELTKQYAFEAEQNSGGIGFLRLLQVKYDALKSASVVEAAELDDSITFGP